MQLFISLSPNPCLKQLSASYIHILKSTHIHLMGCKLLSLHNFVYLKSCDLNTDEPGAHNHSRLHTNLSVVNTGSHDRQPVFIHLQSPYQTVSRFLGNSLTI